jgi:single-strand DNA-binding protein
MGNLTRDPEMRYTPKGMAIAKLGLAVNRAWRTETGELKEEVTFVDVDAFGKQAETLGNHIKKGNPILIEGRLRLETWDDKQTGQKRSRLGVVLENFRFVGPANRSEGGEPVRRSAQPQAAQAAQNQTAPPESEAPPVEEDDVPF